MSTTKLTTNAFMDFLILEDKNDQYVKFEAETDGEKVVGSLS